MLQPRTQTNIATDGLTRWLLARIVLRHLTVALRVAPVIVLSRLKVSRMESTYLLTSPVSTSPLGILD